MKRAENNVYKIGRKIKQKRRHSKRGSRIFAQIPNMSLERAQDKTSDNAYKDKPRQEQSPYIDSSSKLKVRLSCCRTNHTVMGKR